MELNNDLFKILYQRANQYAVNRFGSEPDRLELEADYIKAVWETYRCGDVDTEIQYISVENLTEDLDAVYQNRLLEEEERRNAAELRRKLEEEEKQRKEKQKRYADYLTLKKEFES